MKTRLGLCLSAAIVSGAIADPVVEFISNAGRFGPGNFTDHSNLDVLPALIGGLALLAVVMMRKARAVIAGPALPRGIGALLPLIFALQMLALYAMETAEQFVVFGHALGSTTWLGGPWPASLAIHVAVCLAVSYALARSRRTIAVTTMRVMRFFSAIVTLPTRGVAPSRARRFTAFCRAHSLPAFRAIGERAPPSLAVKTV